MSTRFFRLPTIDCLSRRVQRIRHQKSLQKSASAHVRTLGRIDYIPNDLEHIEGAELASCRFGYGKGEH